MSDDILSLIQLAIREDIGSGDITSNALVPADQMATAEMIAKEALVVCGLEVSKLAFTEINQNIMMDVHVSEGQSVSAGQRIATVQGPLRGILAAERIALNILQRLSGIATTTSKLTAIAQQGGIVLLDTRKTTPGWRMLEKHAVKIGGGQNHRFGLHDAVLIKNNHIDSFGGGITKAVQKARADCANGVFIEIEVRNEDELQQALEGRPDGVLLDNMSPEEVLSAVLKVRAHEAGSSVRIEASGGINEDNLESYLESGVDAISMGALTHSVRAADIALHISGA